MITQVIANGLIAASVISLVAVGFAIIFSCTRFYHFAHGATFTLGAYFALFCTTVLHIPLSIAFPLSGIFCAISGCAMELLIYRKLRTRGASPTVLLLASLGMYVVLQNAISIIFGDNTVSIRNTAIAEGMNLLGARVTPVQMAIMTVSVALVAISYILLRMTKIGLAMRAVAENLELARISGIDSDKVTLWAFAVGSGLAGVAGVLVAMDVDMTPMMGMNALMMGVITVIIGGVGSIPGVVLAALLLGMAQHIGIWRIGSQWQDAIAFTILVGFLLLRPQGFFGKQIRSATV